MLENEIKVRRERHPVASIILILAVVGMGFIVIGPLIGFLFSLPFYSGSMTEFAEAVQQPMDNPDLKLPLYIMQGFATFVGLIVGPAWFLHTEQKSLKQFFEKGFEWTPALITAVVVIVFMGVNSALIEWNADFRFPEFAKNFEKWAREREDLAAELTEFLTKFNSVTELIIAMIVIAIIPAFGEEIVFRGIIQKQLHRATSNIHISIWFAAFLFSAIHFQFFGFVPRMLLGALFGYLYYWSGNLWLPVLAHFVNNGFSVLAMYFYQKGTMDFDLEKTESVPMQMVIISGVLTAALLYYFFKYFENRKPIPDPL
jgi:membrane protease YdiL (CAAX protease family)